MDTLHVSTGADTLMRIIFIGGVPVAADETLVETLAYLRSRRDRRFLDLFNAAKSMRGTRRWRRCGKII